MTRTERRKWIELACYSF